MPNGNGTTTQTTFSNILAESVRAFKEIWTTIKLTPGGTMQVVPPPPQPANGFVPPSGFETVAKYALLAGLLILAIAAVLFLVKRARR